MCVEFFLEREDKNSIYQEILFKGEKDRSNYCVVSIFRVILVRIQSKCGKIRTRTTPNTDTFYVVIVSKTAKNFSSDRKQVRSWLKDEQNIVHMKNKSRVNRYAKEKYPLMEKKLHEEFLEPRKKETSVRRCWFALHRRQIYNDTYPETEFEFSTRWFGRIFKRNGISLRKKTHKNQKDPVDSYVVPFNLAILT